MVEHRRTAQHRVLRAQRNRRRRRALLIRAVREALVEHMVDHQLLRANHPIRRIRLKRARRLLQNCARLFPAQERQDFRRDSAHADGVRQQFFHQRPQDIRPKRPIRRGNRDFRRRAERCPAAFTRLMPGFLQHERRANPHHAACKRNFPRLQHGDDIPAQLPRFHRQRRVRLARRQRHGEGQAHPPEGHRRQAVQQHFHHALAGGTARALVIIHRTDAAGVIAAGGGDGFLAALGLQGAETIRALKWAVPLPVWQEFGVALRGGVIRQMQRCIQLAAQFRRTRHAQQAEIILAREGDCPPVAAGMAALTALAVEIGVIIRHKEIARVHRASAPSNDFRDDYSTFSAKVGRKDTGNANQDKQKTGCPCGTAR